MGTQLGTKPEKHRLRQPTDPTVWKVPVSTTKSGSAGYAKEIAVGDLLFLLPGTSGPLALLGITAGQAYPFSAMVKTTYNASVGDYFLGVALQNSKNGESDDILVGVDGIYEFNCTHAATTVGQYVAVANGSASLESASVGIGATGNDIGRIAQATVAADDGCYVQIKSKIYDATG